MRVSLDTLSKGNYLFSLKQNNAKNIYLFSVDGFVGQGERDPPQRENEKHQTFHKRFPQAENEFVIPQLEVKILMSECLFHGEHTHTGGMHGSH